MIYCEDKGTAGEQEYQSIPSTQHALKHTAVNERSNSGVIIYQQEHPALFVVYSVNKFTVLPKENMNQLQTCRTFPHVLPFHIIHSEYTHTYEVYTVSKLMYSGP